MHKSPETFVKFLDLIAASPNLTKAAKAIGASAGTPYVWMKASAEAERLGNERSIYRIEWPTGSGETEWFHRLIARARSMYKVQFELAIRQEALPISEGGGVERILTDANGIVYRKIDPIKLADMVQFLGHNPADVWERDKDGNRIPEIIREPAPAHAKIHVSRALLPEYGDHRSLTINGTVQHGVISVPGRPQRPALAAPATSDVQNGGGRPQEPEPDDPNETELSKLLRKLDAMPQTPMVLDFKRMAIERAANGPQRRGIRPAPSTSRPDDPPERTGDGRPAAKPYVSPEARSEGIGRGTVPPGGARISGAPERQKFQLDDSGYPINNGQGAAQPRKMV